MSLWCPSFLHTLLSYCLWIGLRSLVKGNGIQKNPSYLFMPCVSVIRTYRPFFNDNLICYMTTACAQVLGSQIQTALLWTCRLISLVGLCYVIFWKNYLWPPRSDSHSYCTVTPPISIRDPASVWRTVLCPQRVQNQVTVNFFSVKVQVRVDLFILPSEPLIKSFMVEVFNHWHMARYETLIQWFQQGFIKL